MLADLGEAGDEVAEQALLRGRQREFGYVLAQARRVGGDEVARRRVVGLVGVLGVLVRARTVLALSAHAVAATAPRLRQRRAADGGQAEQRREGRAAAGGLRGRRSEDRGKGQVG